MSQSNGITRLKRMSFRCGNASFDFQINPEEYNQIEPSRATVTQTKAGGWLDDFGAGVAMITIKGTTGFKGVYNDATQGYNRFVAFRDFIRTVYSRVSPGQEVTEDKEMLCYNFTDNEYWVVYPKVFSLMRSVARPLLYLYDIQLICLRKASDPPANAVASNQALQPVLSRVEVFI